MKIRNSIIALLSVKPVIFDGILYVLIALLGGMEATFTSDESFKYMNVYFIYYAKTITVWSLEVVTAIKMFRSTSYSDHLKDKLTAQTLLDGNNKTTITNIESKTNETQIKTVPSSSVSNTSSGTL